MKKKYFYAFLGLLVIAGILGGIKALQINKMIAQSSQLAMPPAIVNTTDVMVDFWEQTFRAVGTLSAVQGVTVTAELPGKVAGIAFEAGAKVKAGDLLVSQDTAAEEALLPGAEATVDLTKKNLDRYQSLFADKLVAQVELDKAVASYRQAFSDLKSLRATLDKKAIRAPFSGRLGIRQVNLGQYLAAGDEIVTLQTLDPVFVDFMLPQQHLEQLKPGLKIRLTSDALSGKTIEGKVATINPKVEEKTRNIRIQGLIDNPDELLRPGMYVDISVVLPEVKTVLAIPATAILYAPYSDTVFVVEKPQPDPEKPSNESNDALILRQQIVSLGERRGDFVEVLSGLREGESIVTTGVFKLRNGQEVKIDNTLQPEFKLQPDPENK